MKPYNQEVDEVIKEYNTSLEGLNDAKVSSLLNTYGENVIIEKKGKSKLKILLNQFNDMMIIILIIVAIVMALYGFFVTHEYTDTIVITVVVLINAIMGYIQEEKAEVTLQGLKKYNVTICKVKRGNKIKLIDSKNIVPGDIIILESGDRVPADARIISENNLYVDESALTGESVPVKKIANSLKGKLSIQGRINMLFCGTNITNGKAVAVVTKTGMMSELGLIAVSLNTPYEVMTPLQLKIKEISKKITFLIFIILIFMFIYGLIAGYKLMEIIMLCVSLAVAAIPEGLPAVITIALSSGASSLAKKKTIVRNMNAVETLGSTDIICTDKTGTVTQNKMRVKKTILYDEKMFKIVACLANETIIEHKKYIGDPTETCLFEYLDEIDFNPENYRNNNKRIIDAPFDSVRKMMSTLNKVGNKNYILVKGSIDSILSNSKYILKNGKKVAITPKLIKSIKRDEKELASDALRVIGFAYKETSKKILKSEDLLKEEKNLIYVGMVGIIDPPRKGVNSSVLKCKKAGIRPIMITGDSLITASAIAKEVGIAFDESECILGEELDDLTDIELLETIKKYNVYARVSPEHKKRIVDAWQKLGYVVAMTGDGVNDAPAIKDAHVGVGMGINGTDVTKSVSDIILLDDSFNTIVVAVEEGRRIFSNIRNNVVYTLSSNFAEIFTVLIGMITGNTILLPIHILFIDLVTDSIPSICLSFEKSEKCLMEENPRGINKPFFTPFITSSILVSSIIETIYVLITYFVALNSCGQMQAMSLALLSLVIQEILYAYSCRNLKKFVYENGIFGNKPLCIGIICLLIIESIVFLTPVGTFISIETISFGVFYFTILFNISAFFIYELLKPILKRLFKD